MSDQAENMSDREREASALALSLAKIMHDLLVAYALAMGRGDDGAEERAPSFVLFVYPHGTRTAAMATDGTREFAMSVCKEWLDHQVSQ